MDFIILMGITSFMSQMIGEFVVVFSSLLSLTMK